MLFNSIDFVIFLPIVFVLYWFVTNKELKYQNLLLVAASYLFYGWWDWRFLSLILFSTVLDYSIGLQLAKQEDARRRKQLLWLSIFVNLSFLGFFKYCNFFVGNFIAAFSFFGGEMSARTLSIVLPVGISFYTFQTLSYSIDIYKRKLEPTKDFIAFSAFVCFFPQLVAGPIERATNLLPQFYKERVFDPNKATDGMRQILWGLFKKVVIADNCAVYVDLIFNNYGDYSGSTLVLGAILFAFQIYGDFSGYSDIAIGISRLFGFNLMRNFAFPYFSRDIAEFWRRWHISLSTWFRDYLYIPLGGSKGGNAMRIRNTIIIFLVSGFWHGANWTFIIWGLLNAFYILPSIIFKTNRRSLDIVAEGRYLPNLKELLSMILTFGLTVFAWIFFRAKSVGEALAYIRGMLNKTLFEVPTLVPMIIWWMIGLFVLVEWLQREKEHVLEIGEEKIPVVLRWVGYLVICLLIAAFFGRKSTFIYFQF